MNFRAPKASVPPMPNPPNHPERPPPNIPIPGEPTAGGEKHEHTYKCKKCGQVFNSKEELKLHMATNHARPEI
jgi:Zinc finger, C2H2 type